jgi:hypothetical protein
VNDADSDKANGRHAAAVAFFVAFLERGLEFCVRGNRLRLWPWKSWPWLTDAERAFIVEHREELKSIAKSKRFGETQVVWSPPTGTAELTETGSRVIAPGQEVRVPGINAADPGAGSSACPYCMRKCVGRQNHWYHVFHWSDPEQIAKRQAEATEEMLHQMRNS